MDKAAGEGTTLSEVLREFLREYAGSGKGNLDRLPEGPGHMLAPVDPART